MPRVQEALYRGDDPQDLKGGGLLAGPFFFRDATVAPHGSDGIALCA
jgi:hypothetical protein